MAKKRGRPFGRRTELVKGRVTPEVMQWLEKYAYDHDYHMTQVISQALEEKMNREG
jgi:hypothetical protein